MREGLYALLFVIDKKVILLEYKTQAVSAQALRLFAARAQRALGLRDEVDIRITSNRELQDLNRRFRKKDRPTDVLSFPSAMPKLLGDIAVSAEIAAANAAALGHSTETEIKILILHGLLHLAGYDHEHDHGKMQSRETGLRRQLQLPAGLIERGHAGGQPSATRGSAKSAAYKRQGRRK